MASMTTKSLPGALHFGESAVADASRAEDVTERREEVKRNVNG